MCETPRSVECMLSATDDSFSGNRCGNVAAGSGGEPAGSFLQGRHASALVGKKKKSQPDPAGPVQDCLLHAIGRPRPKQVGIGRDTHSRAGRTRYRALSECNASSTTSSSLSRRFVLFPPRSACCHVLSSSAAVARNRAARYRTLTP